MDYSPDKHNLITRNLQEVIGDDDLRKLLAGDQPVCVYWGTATTGKPHIAYFVPIIKLADMLQAGMKVIILFADLHAYLDNMKAPWALLRYRTQYYESLIKSMFQSVDVPLDRLHFVRGSDYQLKEAYTTDVYRLVAVTSVHDARKAGAEVVKQVTNPLVSGLLYPLLQALDEVHLGVDAQFGGVDQRKIFILAEKYLPHLGQKKRIHLMNPMVPGLTGAKMSSSEIDSKIDLLDSADLIRKKLQGASCPPATSAAQGNGVLAFLKYVVFPLTKSGLHVAGHTSIYADYASLEQDYLDGMLSADAIKQTVVESLNRRLDGIRAQFEDPRLAALVEHAYPTSDVSTLNSIPDSPDSLTGWFRLLWNNRFVRALRDTVMTYWPFSGIRQMGDLSFDVSDLIANVSDTPRSLDQRDKHLPPVRDKNGLIAAFEEEFPGSSADIATILQSVSHVRCLWSVTPMGLPHLGHSIPLRKLARLSQFDGVHIIVLVNNVSAHLRDLSPWNLIEPRGSFCRIVLTALFQAVGGRISQFSCLLGSEFQLAGDYMLELYRLVSLVPEADCLAASSATTTPTTSDLPPSALEDKDEDNEKSTPSDDTAPTGRLTLGQLLVPCVDFLDSVYLKAHIRLASGERSRKRHDFEHQILPTFSPNSMPTLHLSHATLPSLQADHSTESTASLPPMRSCLPASRLRNESAAATTTVAAIQLAALAEDRSLPLVEPASPGSDWSVLLGLKRRLKRAFCQPGNVTVNPVLDLYRLVILPLQINNPDDPLVIPRAEKNGGPLRIDTTDGSSTPESRWLALQRAFASELLHPGDLKPAAEQALISDNPESLGSRLIKYLPPWSELSCHLDAAFPVEASQPRPKSKKTPKPETTAVTTNGTPSPDVLDANRLDIRIGRILEVSKHPNADSLYVEQVDFGPELGHRTVVSGLVGLYPLAQLQGQVAVFVTNLKPVRMRGVESQAMLLCASHTPPEPDSIRLVRPLELPASLANSVGSRLVFHRPDCSKLEAHVVQPDSVIHPKTKLWERLCPDLRLSGNGRVVHWRDWRLGDKSGTYWVTGAADLPEGATVS